MLYDNMAGQVYRVRLRRFARVVRRMGAIGLLPTGIRLSKSSVTSLAWGMLNSSIRSKSADPAVRSAFPMS